MSAQTAEQQHNAMVWQMPLIRDQVLINPVLLNTPFGPFRHQVHRQNWQGVIPL